MSEDYTARFRVDISNLRKNLTAAQNSVKKANAEFKASTAGMDDWTKDADGLSAKLKQLDDVLNAQKSILSNYRQQLERQQEAFDKNGERAAKLREKIAGLTIETEKDAAQKKKYEAALKRIEAEQERNAKTADDLKIKILNQQAAIGKTEKETRQFTTQLEELRSAEDKAGNEADDLSADIKDIETAAKNTKGDADDLGKSVKDAGDKAETASSKGFTILKGALADLAAQGIRKAAQGLKNLVTDVINTGTEFDGTMASVQAISGATDKQIGKLEESAKNLGATTKFTASEVGDGFKYMAMAGWDVDSMLGGIDGILSLAAASGEDLATTSDIVTDALTAFGYKASDAGHFADVLAIASSNANTNVSMMGETFKYVGAASGALGYSAEDVALSVGLMANAGIKASQAGTELNSIFTRLAVDTNGARSAIEDLGIQFYDENGQARAWGDILTALRIKTRDYTDQQKLELANTIAGQRAQAGLLAMLNASTGDYNKLTVSLKKADGAAQDMADTMLDNLGGKVTLMKSAWEGFQLSLYDSVDTPLQDVVGTITDDVIPALGDLVKGTDGAGAKLGKGIGSIFSKILDVLSELAPELVEAGVEIVGSVFSSIGRFLADKSKMDKLSKTVSKLIKTIFSKITDAIPVIAKLLPRIFENIATLLIENAKPITDGIASLIRAIAKSLPTFIKIFFGEVLPNLLEALMRSIEETLPVILDAISELITAIIKELPTIIKFIAKLLPVLVKTLVTVMIQLQDELTEALIEITMAIFETLPEVIKVVFTELIPAIFQAIWGVVVLIAEKVGEKLELIFKPIWDAIVNAWESIKEVFSTIGTWIYDNIISPIADSFKGLWDGIVSAFHTVVDPWIEIIKRAFSAFKEKYIDPVLEWFRDLWEGIKGVWEQVSGWFNDNVIEPVKNLFTSMWNGLTEKAGEAWEGVKKAFSPVVDWFKDVFSKAWQGVKDVFSTGGRIFEGIKDGIVNVFKTVVNGIIGGINNVISWAFGGLNDALQGLHDMELFGVRPFDWVRPFDVPQIPQLASGGVLKRGQMGLLEGSGAEAVVPLERNKAWIHQVAADMVKQLGFTPNGATPAAATSSGSVSFTQNVYSPQPLSRYELYRQTKNLFELEKRRI